MNVEYPIIIKKVLPDSKFYSLRDEFNYAGWKLENYSYKGGGENDKISWMLNESNNKLIMYECASIIKLKIQKYLKQDLILIKVHSNGATVGQTQKFHIDFDKDDIWTFVLFTEENWNTQWGGEFVSFDPINNTYKYTPFMPNSGALIPSNWEHYGAAPNVYTDNLRTTMAFSYSSLQSFDYIKNSPTVRSFL